MGTGFCAIPAHAKTAARKLTEMNLKDFLL
jgi:hypothetical protein